MGGIVPPGLELSTRYARQRLKLPQLGFSLALWGDVVLAAQGVRCPNDFHFRDTLPREPTGELMKRLLREDYSMLE